MILIFSVILFLIDVCHPLIDPTIAACIDGEFNTAVLTADGSTYIFMSHWFWKLNENLDSVVGNVGMISDNWTKLPTNIETSFYVSDTNRLNGKTFFVKRNQWFQYNNQNFEEFGKTDNWTNYPKKENVLAISQNNDPIIVFYQKHYIWFKPLGFYFDSTNFPESKALIDHSLPFSVSETEAFVSYPDGKYLIFFDNEKYGEHCLMKDTKICETNKLNRDLFKCPDFTKDLFERNLLIRIWYWSGLSLHQFGIVVLGIVVSLSLILLFSLIFIGFRLTKLFKKKCGNQRNRDSE